MNRFYTVDDCIRKANQHSEMGSLAASDGDKEDAARHFELDRVWQERAREGGWAEEDEEE